jgi:co-chaperonin GroES (HSP10)
MSSKRRIIAKTIFPLKDNILVADMKFGDRKTKGGLLLPADDMEQRGIRPRWCRVIAVGPKNEDVKPGEWVYVEHGRWTRGMDITDPETDETITVRMVDPKCIIMSADEPLQDDTVRDKLGIDGV